MTFFQIFVLAGAAVFLIVVLRSVYNGLLKEAYALLWIAVTLITGIFALFPKLLSSLAEFLGVVTPAFALILCMLGGILLLLFQMTVIISGHHEKLTRLLEELALLKEELDSQKKKLDQLRPPQSGVKNDK